jgi:hydroxypyruvate reductase
LTPNTLARARVATLDPPARLVNHHGLSFFDGIGDLIRAGPAGTNVNDIRTIHQGRPTGRLTNETQSPG